MNTFTESTNRSTGHLRTITRAWVALTTVILLMAVAPVYAAGPGGPVNLDAAISKARTSGKLLVLVFEHEGCPACMQYHQNLQNPKAQRALARAVTVHVETTDNPRLTAEYGAERTPTTVILGPANDYASPLAARVGALQPSELEGTIRQFASSRTVAMND